MLLDTVRKTVNENDLIKKGDKVICAVSGGADSMCLLYLMLSLKDEYMLDIYAANVNHCIRGEESDSDSKFVKEICKKYGIELFYREYNVPAISAETKTGIEECARKLRYEFFEETAKKLGGAKIATAHNLNDNAETVIFRLARGSSAAGISGISPKRGDIIRPLINVKREEIEKYLIENDKKWCTDSTNFDAVYARNRIRINIIPELKRIFPSAEEKIAGAAFLIGEDNEYLDLCAKDFEKEYCDRAGFNIKEFLALPKPVMRRVARDMLSLWETRSVTSDKIEALISLAKNESGKEFDINGDYAAKKSYDKIVLYKKENIAFLFTVGANGTAECEKWKLMFKILDKPVKKRDNNIAVFDYGKIGNEFRVRPRASGDRMNIQGTSGTKKLSDIFSDAKTPYALRSQIPLVEYNGEIIYLCGLRQTSKYNVDKNTKEYLVIEFTTKEW